jgi:omega-6 fatty acid desaturase (delta-12 desaturase)
MARDVALLDIESDVDFTDDYVAPGESTAAVSRWEVRRALAEYAPPSTPVGLAHFCTDIGLYAAAIAGVLFLEPLWLKIVCSIAAGVKISNLGTLAHDSAHGNLTASTRLNKLTAIIALLVCVKNYRLWCYDHHHIHHPYTNGDHPDAWTPMSKAKFDRLPLHRQWLERLYRSSYGMGLAPYYIIERWWQVKVFPRSFLPKRFRASAWRHFALLATYTAGFTALLAAAPLYSSTGSVTAVLLGLVLPFYIWMTFYSFTGYVLHTHARIPWIEGAFDRKTAMPPETLSLDLHFPAWVDFLSHNVYNHAAHHVNVRIPFYRLRDAQHKLNELAGHAAVIQPFSFRWLHETLRDCRLYDFEHNRWLDFNGRPTSATAVSDAQREAMVRHGPGTMFVPQH